MLVDLTLQGSDKSLSNNRFSNILMPLLYKHDFIDLL